MTEQNYGFRFRDWDIYQDSRVFREDIIKLLRIYPAEEKFSLVDQTRRALNSILLAIAEGANKNSDKEIRVYINRAHTSIDEVVACLDCALDDGYINTNQHANSLEKASSLAKRLWAFNQHLASDRSSSIVKSHSQQHGVTMLFAVFVVATISIISLTVGFFAVEEIRASRAVALSEPALMAAETAGEEGLWLIKRGSGLSNCTDGSQQEVLTDSKTVITKCTAYISAVINVTPTKSFTFYLYDPNNINGNLNPGYQNIVVTYVSGNLAASVAVHRIDGTVVSTTNIIPGGNPLTIPLPTNPLDDNRFKVTITSSGIVTLDVNTNLGMPDYPTLAAEGCAARSTDPTSCSTSTEAFKRKLNILVPQ